VNQPPIPPKLGIVIAVMALSVPAIFIRLADSDPLSIAFLRLFFASLLLWPVSFIQVRRTWKSLDGAYRWRIIFAGIFLGIHMVLWVTAVTKTTIASASFLIITEPLIVAALGHFVIKERINRWVVYAIILSFAGIGLINGGDMQLGPQYLWGDFLALLGAAFAAFYLLAGKSVRLKVDILPYITIAYSTSAIVLLPACLIVGAPLLTLSANTYFWCLMLALIPTLIGHSLFNWALRYLKAFTVNIGIVVEPIGATIMAWFIFQEQPSAMLYPGAALLIAALIVAFRGEEA
jgi:drug/metabolite transporter (DMT)-like permease